MVMRTRRPVLAGIDASPECIVVASLAAAEASRRGAPLRLFCSRPYVLARRRPGTVGPSPGPRTVAGLVGSAGSLTARGRATSRGRAESGVPVLAGWPARSGPDGMAGVEDAVQDLRIAHPDLDVTIERCRGDLPDALVEHSREAGLVVVDARRTGGRDAVLGRWLPNRVITHAHCPVLVVGARAKRVATAATRLPVLVGIDGSAHSTAALGYAFEAAALRQVPLWAIRVHCVNPNAPGVSVRAAGYGAGDAQARAADLVAETLSGWIGKYPQVTVIGEPRYARDAGSALVDASAAADLVVVGSRGRTAITSLVLGSVSRALVRYAHCPVLVAHAWI
jgi:nucleotide-binding universal stress UspA family protein